MSWRNVLNAVLFQAVWFATVLGAAHGMPWLGPLTMLPVLYLHLRLSDNRRAEVALLLAAGITGFLFDTVMNRFGVFVPHPWLLPAPFSPPWMAGLWINLATTLNYSLGWLQGRPITAAIFGALGGPLAYFSGARLGAAVGVPSPEALLILAIAWGCVIPVLFHLARLVNALPASADKAGRRSRS